MKVVKNMQQFEELVEEKKVELLNLLDSPAVGSYTYILEAASDDNELISVIENNLSPHLVGHGGIMKDVDSNELHHWFCCSLVEKLNANTFFNDLSNEYLEIKNEVDIISQNFYELLKSDIKTYHKIDDTYLAYLENFDDHEKIHDFIKFNDDLHYYIKSGFNESFEKFDMKDTFINNVFDKVINDNEISELSETIEKRQKHTREYSH